MTDTQRKQTVTQFIHAQLGVKETYKAPEAMLRILYDKEKREIAFNAFLEYFDYEMDRDWFTEYFQEEHAERKTLKQDFTPQSLSRLLAELTANGSPDVGERLDVAAGSGGLTIAKWQEDRIQFTPWDYRPSEFLYVCEEYSDRTIPFLLFNLLIRGMNAVVIHGDSLSRECKGIFFVQNDADHPVGFSSLNLLPYSDGVADMWRVKFTEEAYDPIKDTQEIPAHLSGAVAALTGGAS